MRLWLVAGALRSTTTLLLFVIAFPPSAYVPAPTCVLVFEQAVDSLYTCLFSPFSYWYLRVEGPAFQAKTPATLRPLPVQLRLRTEGPASPTTPPPFPTCRLRPLLLTPATEGPCLANYSPTPPTCRLRPLPAALMDSRNTNTSLPALLNSRMASSRASSGVAPSMRLGASRAAGLSRSERKIHREV